MKVQKYDHKKVEKKWQKVWETKKFYRASDTSKQKKFYPLVEFPFPSGAGLHTGHIRSYAAMDAVARKRRAENYNVLYPIGWDAFGLPTENYALKTGVQPKVATKKNTDNFRRQLKALGLSFDWSREVNTTDPAYYKWTQWIFLQLYKKGLAYKAKMSINWCPKDKTGLANEEVIDGKCERCGTPVEKRDKEQWMLAITKYADRLDKDLDDVNYLEKIKIQQRNWIGKSEGSELSFKIKDHADLIDVFTTRADTLFGVTYIVLAPEHALLQKLRTDISNWKEVEKYISDVKNKEDIDRTAEGKEKTGVELKGISAMHPLTGEELSVWIADYVLSTYGSGAVMAVPAHDSRDFDFATKFKLPIKEVLEPITGTPKENEEKRQSIVAIVKDPKTNKYLSINWGSALGGNLFVGGGRDMNEGVIDTAKREITEETGYKNVKFISQTGKIHHHYFAHSKNVARNIEAVGLYFELVDDEKTDTALEKDEQGKFTVEWITDKEAETKVADPLHAYVYRRLVKNEIFTGEGILVNSGKFDGLESLVAQKEITKAVDGKMVTRFKLRDWVFSRQRYWGEPIPLVHCEDCGWVAIPEKDLPVVLPPVKNYQPTDNGESPLAAATAWVKTKCPTCKGPAKRETDTMPQWAGSSWYYLRYVDTKNKKVFADPKKLKEWTPVDWYNGGMEHTTLHLLYSRFWHKFLFDLKLVPTKEPYMRRTSHGMVLAEGGEKMSKSKGNTVSPDELITLYGADTVRIYEMFMGPFDQAISWNTANMIGSRRFLERVWNLHTKVDLKKKGTTSTSIDILLNQTIKKVSDDIESMAFNTAISSLMILLNALEKEVVIYRQEYEVLLQLLAPFAPHITEELWAMVGNKKSIHLASWPKFDPAKLQSATFKIVVQVNSRVRAMFDTDSDDEKIITEKALALPEIKARVGDKKPERIVYVPRKLINIVVSEN